jgi:eukaryotic-like serine/threonine-protein kinase
MRASPVRKFAQGILLVTALAVGNAPAQRSGTGLVGPPKPLTNSAGMLLVPIPAGEFVMGSPDSDKDAEVFEKPQLRVRIGRPFDLSAHEVTQEQYKAVMGENPSFFSASGRGKDRVAGRDTGRHPVEQVSWGDAVAFCNRLSAREDRRPYYRTTGEGVVILGGDGYRLPTSAEWEYACRAGSATRYAFGDDARQLDQYGWYEVNSGGTTHPVGAKRPNGFGLFDMHGSVWEWCVDGIPSQHVSGSPMGDPNNPSRFPLRLIRGGCWYDPARKCRSASRGGCSPGFRIGFVGFRVARDSKAR